MEVAVSGASSPTALSTVSTSAVTSAPDQLVECQTCHGEGRVGFGVDGRTVCGRGDLARRGGQLGLGLGRPAKRLLKLVAGRLQRDRGAAQLAARPLGEPVELGLQPDPERHLVVEPAAQLVHLPAQHTRVVGHRGDLLGELVDPHVALHQLARMLGLFRASRLLDLRLARRALAGPDEQHPADDHAAERGDTGSRVGGGVTASEGGEQDAADGGGGSRRTRPGAGRTGAVIVTSMTHAPTLARPGDTNAQTRRHIENW